MKQHNFSAGPSILAENVIEQASKSVLEINNSGLSILEISHRGSVFTNIMHEAQKLTKELLNIPENYEVLFLQGGASLQFYMCALNFLKTGGAGGYIDTGTWSKKAIIESKKVGKTVVINSSEDTNYTYIPKNIIINQPLDYIHFTSNNTIYGTQFHDFKQLFKLAKQNKTKLICDMSSDIFSKEFDVSHFDLIYAGAQKNIGPAGTTLIIINKDSIENNSHLPTYLNYNTHIKKESMFNTPPVFPIYVAMLTLKWIQSIGGLKQMEIKNQHKATKIYTEIDRNPLFVGLVNKEDRSTMNATFDLKHKNMKTLFEKMCSASGISGLSGHRSVGGYRASMYNALNIESIDKLIEIMQDLEKKYHENNTNK